VSESGRSFGARLKSTFRPDHLPLLLRHPAKPNIDFPPSTPLDPALLMDDNTSQVNVAVTTADGTPPGIAVQVATSSASLFGETKPASDSSSPATPLITPKFHPDSLITLLVGPEEEELVVYETYLSRDSAFFKAALKKQWAEGQTRIIKLPEESLEPMEHYVEQLYGGKLPTLGVMNGQSFAVENSHYDMLGQLYVLGERMLNSKLQNSVIREILRLSQLKSTHSTVTFPSTKCISTIYEGTTSASPARRMMVDFAISYGHQGWFEIRENKEYLVDFSKALLRKMAAQKSANDFRGVSLKAKDYLVSEEA
jgi:hypothetical protein